MTIEYKQYGVGLAFSPTVLEDGRISIRVRPEVSELSSSGGVRFNGYEIPSLTTRRVETTVELGSGQSFMIGGLLRNHNNNSIDRAPFLGNIPILGALFRSSRYRREETELVIVVTPDLCGRSRRARSRCRRRPSQPRRGASCCSSRPMPAAAASSVRADRPEPRTVAPGVGTVGRRHFTDAGRAARTNAAPARGRAMPRPNPVST